MKFFIFVATVSIASRIIWSKKHPFGGLKEEVNFMFLTIIVNLIWFTLCSWAFNITFP